MYLSFLTILTVNILTSLLHLNLKKTLNFLLSMLKYLAQAVNFLSFYLFSFYRKPTFTGLFTHFHSFIPLAYKRSLVSCLLHRIFNFFSSYENFHVQLEVVRKLFILKGFPSHMFNRLVRRFLNNIFEPKPSVPKRIVYFCLCFTALHSLQIRNQITRLCNAAYPHLNIRFVFHTHLLFLSF